MGQKAGGKGIHVRGEGVPGNPFDSRARDIVELLRENPRLKASDIRKELVSRGLKASRFAEENLVEGPLGSALEYRLALKPLRWEESSPNKLMLVRLRDDTSHGCEAFEAELANISGVIECDKLKGDFDYLVRITRADMSDISDEIKNSPLVDDARFTNFDLMASRYFGNFTADHFWDVEQAGSADSDE